jgi:hypothetical protein
MLPLQKHVQSASRPLASFGRWLAAWWSPSRGGIATVTGEALLEQEIGLGVWAGMRSTA